uniref:BHLH domain-containing protein n=1 Tax=Strigamia maritima TaxID=126957 RepID=T1JAK5_STRMM
MAEPGLIQHARCDYKRLQEKTGLQRLRNLIPNSSEADEVKVIVEAIFYVHQLEVKAEQLRNSVRRNKNKNSQSSTMTSPENFYPVQETLLMEQKENTDTGMDLPEDLKDVDETELRKLHPMPLDVKIELNQLEITDKTINNF